jgi:uncharacterized protein involved in exopolysaccharide biosynthesis
MEETNKDFGLLDYWNIIWKKKWLVFVPTFICVMVALVLSYIITPVWEIKAIIQPSKYIIQTGKGSFQEFAAASPQNIAAKINEGGYDLLVAAVMEVKADDVPDFKGETLEGTNLIGISTKGKDIKVTKKYLNALWDEVRKDLDFRIDLENRATEGRITHKKLNIKDFGSGIKRHKHEKSKFNQSIISLDRMIKISKDRVTSIEKEMTTVGKRIEDIEEQQKKALEEKTKESDIISRILYLNEIQRNVRHLDSLDESRTLERNKQEEYRLQIKEAKEEMRMLDTDIEQKNHKIAQIQNEIQLLEEQKARVEYAKLTKEPKLEDSPAFPKKKLMVIVAFLLSLSICIMIALFLDYFERQKA